MAQLWRAYNHLLLRYFRGKGMPDPDDLASTVWVEVARSLGRFEGDERDFRRWLFTIAARRRIDGIRSSKRDADKVAREAASTTIFTARSSAEDAEAAGALGRAVALVQQLPPDQAEAVLLRVVADLSVSEVATIMGKREGNVRVLVHRGLAALAVLTQANPIPRADVTEPPHGTMSSP